MQDWDRLVMIGLGLLVAAYTGRDAYRYWRRRRLRAVAGIGLLMVATVLVPVLLALLAT